MKQLMMFIGLIMIFMMTPITPVSSQELGGEQVFDYRTKEQKEDFDLQVWKATRRNFGFFSGQGGQGGMDFFTRKAVDFVILEKNVLIPVTEKNGAYKAIEKFSFNISDVELSRLLEKVIPIKGEVFEDLHFSDALANENKPVIDNHYQEKIRYTNGPDLTVPFLRKDVEIFKPEDGTRSFSKGYTWKIVPGPKGIALAKERKMRVDMGLRFIPPNDVKRMYDNYDKLADYYAKNGVPSLTACTVFENKLSDDYKVTPNDTRYIPEGFYAAIPSREGYKDEVTWKDFHAIRLILISHEEKKLKGCDDCDESKKEEEKKGSQTKETDKKETGTKTPSYTPTTTSPASRGNTYNQINNYYGALPDSSQKEEEKEEVITVQPKPLLRGFLMGTYGWTMGDDNQEKIYGLHVGYYPFSDSSGFARRIGIGIGYEHGGYSSSRETNHNLGTDGYYGKSFLERNNGSFDGFYASLHLITVTNNVEKDWLSIYGSVGYRWYKADENAVGRTYTPDGIIVEEEKNLISPLTKEMFTFGFGLHIKPSRSFIIGLDAKFGKSEKGWDYGVSNMPLQFSGADKNSLLKSMSVKLGFCF